MIKNVQYCMIRRQSWHDNFFLRMKMILVLLSKQRRSVVLQCLYFATGARKWPRFAKMFKALFACWKVCCTTNCCLQLTAVDLFDLTAAVKIILMFMPFSLIAPKEDAAQNVLNSQVSLLLQPMFTSFS